MATTTLQNSSETTKGGKRPKAKGKGQARRSSKIPAEALASRLYREGRDAVSSAYDSASQAGVRARIALPKLRNKLHLRERSQSAYSMMEERPLVLGAVGLGVGMVLATLLPSLSSQRSKR